MTSWRAIGAAIARLHRGGVDHADLNAHNILLDGRGAVSVIDFDRGRVRGARRMDSAKPAPAAPLAREGIARLAARSILRRGVGVLARGYGRSARSGPLMRAPPLQRC